MTLDVYQRLGFTSEEAEQLHEQYLRLYASRFLDEEEFAIIFRNVGTIWPQMSAVEQEMLIRESRRIE